MLEQHAPESLISFAEVQRQLGGCCRQTIYNLLARDPKFPRPVKLTRYQMWRRSEVDEFIRSLPHVHRKAEVA